MIWLAWRRQRTETLIALGLVALLAAWLVPVGLHMASVFDEQGLSACVSRQTHACHDLVDTFTMRFDRRGLINAALNFVPGLIGVLLAAPILLELERGTYRMTWTQSVTRGRFVAGRLGFALVSGVVAALLLTGLLTWWRLPLDRLHGRMEQGVFDLEGTVVIGYVLFATALSLALGAITRRAVPALVVGFAGYAALRIFVTDWLRQRFVAPVSVLWHVTGRAVDPVPRHAWVISEFASDAHGQPVQLVRDCAIGSAPSCVPASPQWIHVIYQPASRFWAFQGIETGLFVGLAGVLAVFAAWWIRERV